MPNRRRPLIYVKASTGERVAYPAFLQDQWDVHEVSHPAAALDLLRKQDFLVGLFHWDGAGADTSTLRFQAELLLDADNRINWVVLLSGVTTSVHQVSRVISSHFYDYHTLPMDPERLSVTLGHAYGMAEIANAYSDSGFVREGESHMVGQSPAMRSLFQTIHKVAAIDLNVMVRGESGTGKELSAQAIHHLSHRAQGPFVAVNCGALPKDLIQAELFGHEKGAFTGADRRKIGRIEAAQNGTLFLDEIGDLPLEMQVNLLRFLQEKTIDRVGGTTPISVDVRVIAATHVNLERAVEEGRFREDLYYRLNVLHLEMPPLRDRGEDIEILAQYFLQQFASKVKPNIKGFSQPALDAIKAHYWPGNVREMVNRVQRAVVMSEGRLVKPKDLGLDQDLPNSILMTLSEARSRAEKEVIEATLAAARNNVSKAARRLDISRVTLYRLMEQHAIDWQGSRDE
ncbi:sigma-54 dependent transcriptional regulator [Thiorhodococcus minor]|uniref:Sigma-54-dependent Fis family transcriptional regulator n=1 Tax=Thiorhodococcus minor TaxID=57489 RepID=A0A6M0JZF0_9GAMM|nr:sigma-54 dependent transcriptional regulator [Thiorhodococcus minor]NEV62842.1 sigma-54-dependent Fis family transcriptional regulator [Thiorhodococcus minor]